MNIRQFNIFFVLIFIFNSFSIAQELEVKPLKEVYFLGEPVNIDIKITNSSASSLVMPLLFVCNSDFITYEISDQDSNLLPHSGEMYDVSNSPSQELRMPPKSRFSVEFDLKSCFTFKEGSYKGIAKYQIKKEDTFDKSVWHGKLNSNVFYFNVVKSHK